MVLAVAFWVGGTSLAGANNYRPNRLGDAHQPNGCTRSECTLRDAISQANSHPGRDVVVLRAGKTYHLQQPITEEDENLSGDLDVTRALTIKTDRRGKRATINAPRRSPATTAFSAGRDRDPPRRR